jgi:uncharacterized membrane protein
VTAAPTREPVTGTTTSPTPVRPPVGFALVLIVAGAVGWWAAFALTLDTIAVLQHPDAVLDCNISVLVQCGKNLSSWQGAIFGFPNPIIGLAAWVAPILVGVSLLAGATFARWYWMLFNLAFAGAMVFIIWFSSESMWVLRTLCPWCMLTWAMVIPVFLIVTVRNAASGVFGSRLQLAGRAGMPWVLPATAFCYLAIGIEAFIAFH